MGVLKKLIFRMKKAVAYLTLSTTSTSTTWSPQTVTNTGAILTWDVTGDITPTSQNVDDPTFNLSANTGTVNMNVYDVGGLTEFYCNSRNITTLDVRESIALTTLNCGFNSGLTALDVSRNVSLINLYVGLSNLTLLNLSTNTSLRILYCFNNNLTTLDVSTNTELTNLQCFSNNLTALDLSTNTSLGLLQCFDNSITTLNISANTLLTSVQCYSNSITTLNISANPLLTTLLCYYNNMSPLVTDQIYIDLDANGQSNGTLHIRNNRTSASDTARATLVSRGWTFNESYTT